MVSASRAAIAGIGATDFSDCSGRTEVHLAAEAILAAVYDTGLEIADVDGMVTFAVHNIDEIHMARSLGIPRLSFFPRTAHGGGGSCSTIQLASLAVTSGMANVVVCFRSLNGRSGRRLGQPNPDAAEAPTPGNVAWSWYRPFGLSTPAALTAMFARRYMHLHGATSEDFGRVSVAFRAYAATNPKAYFYKSPVTLAVHQESRWITEPLRLLDCCLETDGAVAIVVTSLERARDLRQIPAVIEASASGISGGMGPVASYFNGEIARLEALEFVATQLWQQSGLTPADIEVLNLYDHFLPAVMMQLDALGFCEPGGAVELVREGAIGPGGRLPTNTNGGQVGEAYIHGMNGIAEAVRQIRGTSVNQVASVKHALVTGGPAVPTGGLILGRE